MRISLKRKSGYTKKAAETDIMKLMLPSILGMLLCAVCLAGTTWAWFTATSDANIDTSNVATFGVEADIQNIGTRSIEGNEIGTYSIDKNTMYSVTLTATGTADSGYCAVTVDGETYYSWELSGDDKLSFSVCSSDGEIEIDTSWKEMTHARATRLRNGMCIGYGEVPTPEDEDKGDKSKDSKDQVTAKPKDSDDNKSEQGSNDTQSEESKEPASEPENSSEAGE